MNHDLHIMCLEYGILPGCRTHRSLNNICFKDLFIHLLYIPYSREMAIRLRRGSLGESPVGLLGGSPGGSPGGSLAHKYLFNLTKMLNHSWTQTLKRFQRDTSTKRAAATMYSLLAMFNGCVPLGSLQHFPIVAQCFFKAC